MKCLIDETGLVITERQGIKIDYCPKCRGVWLDRGELDKISERLAASMAQVQQVQPPVPPPPAQTGSFTQPPAPPPLQQRQPQPYPAQPYQSQQGYPQQGYSHQGGHGQPHDPRHRKKSFFGELFDFD